MTIEDSLCLDCRVGVHCMRLAFERKYFLCGIKRKMLAYACTKAGERVMTQIKNMREGTARIPDILCTVLPNSLWCELCETVMKIGRIDELRLRADKRVSVSIGAKNILLEYRTSTHQLSEIFGSICEGSLYAHASTIAEGYITLAGGVRVGIVGRAVYEDERLMGVYDISGLCFRLPDAVMGVGERVCRLLRGGVGGVLIYAPPSEGKTTLLRSVAAKMASGEEAWRVCVIDSRGELAYALGGEALLVDTLIGYRRALGMEIAARSMNAQLIVCDELGSVEEAQAILALSGCGVPFLATAHAASIEQLLSRTGLAMLAKARVFGAFVGIRRVPDETEYEYNITYADKLLTFL